jgi:hypothetical protein
MGITPTDGIGNAANNPSDGCFSEGFVSIPTTPQFCTRCQREVQLGTNGSFQAQCNGTLYLYFNGQIGDFNTYSNYYTVTVNGITTNVPAYDPSASGIGIAVGTVTNGQSCSYTASGYCFINPSLGQRADANGVDPATTNTVTCLSTPDNDYFDVTNSICPSKQCFSLVGRIQ